MPEKGQNTIKVSECHAKGGMSSRSWMLQILHVHFSLSHRDMKTYKCHKTTNVTHMCHGRSGRQKYRMSVKERRQKTQVHICVQLTHKHKNIFRQWRELSLGTNRCFAPCQWDVRAHVRVPASEFTFNCTFHAGEEMKIAHSNYRHSWSNVARRASIRVYGDTTNWRVFGVLTRKNSNFLGIQIRAIKKCANCRAIPQTRNMRRETKRLLVFGMSVRVPL